MQAHPTYIQKRRRIFLVAYTAIGIGVIGFIMPLIPGILFLLLGLSILSIHSRTAHGKFAELRARYPQITHQVERMETWVTRVFNLATHSHEYVTIPARNQKSLSALVEVPTTPTTGTVIVLHSASGTKETPISAVLAEVYRARGFAVVRFDAHDSLGESGGTYTSFNTSDYAEDLEDVVRWLQDQDFSNGSLALAGHSIGALVAGEYAETHPDTISELALFAPTISGNALYEAFTTNYKEMLDEWEKEGIRPTPHPLSGETYSLSHSFLEDAQQHDLLPQAATLTMPVYILSGTGDTISPPADCKRLADAIGPHVQYHEIHELPHTPTKLKDIQSILHTLIQKS